MPGSFAQTGVNFSLLVYSPNFDMWAVPLTVNPVASQPSAGAYPGRGIYDSRSQMIVLDDNSIIQTQDTIVDILAAEFPIPPQQNDIITIPKDCNGALLGDFQVTNSWNNGGGEITLTLRKMV
jgi:hypothetical protein